MTTHSDRLLAAYARFAQDIAAIPDLDVQELHRVASGVPEFVSQARLTDAKPTPSQIAAGLEEGLREMPEMIGALDLQWRWAVSRALRDALAAECPEFLVVDAQRLQQVLAHGKIRTQAEFHLVRYQIDVLEAEPELGEGLRKLYSLVDAYQPEA